MRNHAAGWPLAGNQPSRITPTELVHLPLPTSADLQQEPAPPIRYAVTCIDNRGRMAAAALLLTLGWKPGDLIKFTVDAQRLITATQTTAPQQASNTASSRAIRLHGHLNMPATVRHRAAIAPGDRLLLAADNCGTLRIFPPRLVSLLLQPHLDSHGAPS